MRSIITLGIVALFVALIGCGGDSSTTGVGDEVFVVDPPFDMSSSPDGGGCTDIYYESDALLPNGVTVNWRSAFGGFEYQILADYTATVVWWLNDGTAEASFVDFGERSKGKTFTPRGRDSAEGDISHNNLVESWGTLDMTVKMYEMHWAVDPAFDETPKFQGDIGNGHFWLILDVDNGSGHTVRAKLGVNVHLEDPDNGIDNRCPD